MVCSCVDNSSSDRYLSLHIGDPFFIHLSCYAYLLIKNYVQYHSASFEGPSYCCSIHEIQRYDLGYIQKVKLADIFFDYFLICMFAFLFYFFVPFFFLVFLVCHIIPSCNIPVSNTVHGEPLLGVIRVCYNIALHRYFHITSR